MTEVEIFKAYRERIKARKATKLWKAVREDGMKETIRENPKKVEYQLKKWERAENEVFDTIKSNWIKELKKGNKELAAKIQKELKTPEKRYDFYLKDWYNHYIWLDNPSYFTELNDLSFDLLN